MPVPQTLDLAAIDRLLAAAFGQTPTWRGRYFRNESIRVYIVGERLAYLGPKPV